MHICANANGSSDCQKTKTLIWYARIFMWENMEDIAADHAREEAAGQWAEYGNITFTK
jgi:hypothetical protein